MEILNRIKRSAKQLPPPISSIIKRLYYSLADIIKKCHATYLNILKHKFKRQYATFLYRKELGKRIDWEHPMDLNEKINWLAFYTDTSEWTRLADKYLVRNFVKERGCEEILIPLYAKYDTVDDINYEALPSKFVLKTNNGSGNTIIVKDKENIDKAKTANILNDSLHSKFGLESAEPHYLRIKPCIVAEKLLEPQNGDLIDYKIWCFHGKPFCIFTCSNRSIANHTADYNLFDTTWKSIDYGLSPQFRNKKLIAAPLHLDKMLEYAERLSNGFSQVRVDLYEVDAKIYFGEMTFTSCMGRMNYFTPEYLHSMGEQIHL